ncbi:hypothetical protein ZIOFF_021561 [Zingiber officinale]|uniref:Reverse transcriptase Ty1/copia-type domain-containing protein n=1 Tax=Zingiber officinale TaxID=94328 RepID=A0A8J5H746_ZINOF|nr:hypothetical protein ZIOFF_021561 [Zingiber officinale]
MPARFWGEAVRHAVYLLNRLPTKALGERTPFEAWMGRKPHLAHLKVFGCITYAKNTTPHLKKLDDRSSPMVYLGVEEGCKAYCLFDPRHNKLQVSRDVIFQENSEWTWNAGADKEDLPEFVVVNAFNTDEVIVTADIEAAAEDVTPSLSLSTPSSTRASSPSTPSSSTQATTSPESHEGPVRYRSIADIYANTEEIVSIDEEENEVMLMMSEEPTCYQEAATEACWSLRELGFKKCNQEHAVYTRGKREASILVGVYVDDLIVTGRSTEGINKFKQQMMTEFEMSDLGLLSYYLGIEVEQQKSRILLRQSVYAKKILSQFQMADCNATKQPMEPKTQLHKDLEGTPIDATEYRRVIGCLRYLLHTRPDLSYSVGMASRYMEKPTSMHHKVVKQILRYLKGTIYFGLAYTKGPQEISIFGYSDSDLAGDLDGRKSTSGMTFYFNESLVSWNSQKQKTVALSSCEAEFMAATTAACQALWLRSLVGELTGGLSSIVPHFLRFPCDTVSIASTVCLPLHLSNLRSKQEPAAEHPFFSLVCTPSPPIRRSLRTLAELADAAALSGPEQCQSCPNWVVPPPRLLRRHRPSAAADLPPPDDAACDASTLSLASAAATVPVPTLHFFLHRLWSPRSTPSPFILASSRHRRGVVHSRPYPCPSADANPAHPLS